MVRKSKFGGVAILSSENLVSTLVKNHSNGNCELSIVEYNKLNLTLITAYRPPETTTAEFKETLTHINQHLQTCTSEIIILAGDFNFKTEVVAWEQTNDGVVLIPTPLRNEGTKLQFQELINLTD